MSRTRHIHYLILIVALIKCGSASSADASIALVTSRASLAGTDNLDWGDLGAELQFVGNPTIMLSDDGLSVTISQQTSSFERRNQGPNWNGNFLPGEELLRTATIGSNARGPMKVDFGTNAIEAFGLQIAINALGAYTAQLELFDSVGGSLGTLTGAGINTSAADGSAMFIGALSDNPSTDFYSVVISIIAGNVPNSLLNDFAVNQADFSPASTDSGVVPEAASIVVWGLLGLSTLNPNSRHRRGD